MLQQMIFLNSLSHTHPLEGPAGTCGGQLIQYLSVGTTLTQHVRIYTILNRSVKQWKFLNQNRVYTFVCPCQDHHEGVKTQNYCKDMWMCITPTICGGLANHSVSWVELSVHHHTEHDGWLVCGFSQHFLSRVHSGMLSDVLRCILSLAAAQC